MYIWESCVLFKISSKVLAWHSANMTYWGCYVAIESRNHENTTRLQTVPVTTVCTVHCTCRYTHVCVHVHCLLGKLKMHVHVHNSFCSLLTNCLSLYRLFRPVASSMMILSLWLLDLPTHMLTTLPLAMNTRLVRRPHPQENYMCSAFEILFYNLPKLHHVVFD